MSPFCPICLSYALSNSPHTVDIGCATDINNASEKKLSDDLERMNVNVSNSYQRARPYITPYTDNATLSTIFA